MKKITLLFALLICSIGFSQDLLLGFESGESGGLTGAFGGGAYTIEAGTGSNTSQVAKIVPNSTGEVWQGTNLALTSNVDLTSTQTMTIDVKSSTAITFLVKVNGGVSGAPDAGAAVTHNGDGTWQTLSFTFNTALDGKAAAANGEYANFVIHAYWANAATVFGDVTKDERTFYVDNIKGPKATLPPPASETLLGFESGESGGLTNAFGGGAYTIEAGTGTNTSQVAKIVPNSTGEVWQGTNLALTSNVDLTATQTMTIDVKSSTAITFLVKVSGGINGAPEAAAEVTHNGDGTWQTLSFTFNTALDGKAAAANGQYANFVIHAYWKAGETAFAGVTKDERTFYVDNIAGPKAGAAPATPEPTDAPPTPPTFAAQNVMSLYSEAYTPAATISNVDWDDSTFQEVTIAGNKVLKVDGGNFIGMNLDVFLNATNMTHLHMDYWISTDHTPGTVLNPKLSNHGNQTAETSAIDITNIIESQDEVKKWQSKDFPLNGARESIKQFLITDAGKIGVYYLDNVYMYVAGTASVKDNLFNVSLYPNPANNRLNISAANTIKNAEIYNVLGKKVMNVTINKTSESIDISNLASGVYMIKYNIENSIGTAKFIKQ